MAKATDYIVPLLGLVSAAIPLVLAILALYGRDIKQKNC